MKPSWIVVLLVLFLQLAAAAPAWMEEAMQEPPKPQPLELGLWGGGGAVANDHGRDTHVWVAGFRMGKIVAGHRSGTFLEYAGELNPAFVVLQDKAVYGMEVIPLLLKISYGEGRKVRPYTELGGGLLFSNSEVPQNTSRFNFTPQVRFGLEFPMHEKNAFILGFQYVHISNANLATRNRGYNTLQLHLGWLWYR